MTNKDRLINALQAYGIPVAELVFREPQTPPYAVLIRPGTSNAYSDSGAAFKKLNRLQLEFYYRDLQDREALETLLIEERFCWDCLGADTYIDGESVYLSRYTFDGY